MVEERDDLLADHAVQLLEHEVTFVAVLDERVLLGHAAQVDPLAHVVHALEVLAPAGVDRLEHDVALEVAHQPFLDALDLPLALARRRRARRRGTRRRSTRGRARRAPRPRRRCRRGAPSPTTRPSRSHSVSSVGVHVDGVRDHLRQPLLPELLGEVLALEHAAPLLVDHLALDVHHVVVLEDVLALDEVLLLDLLLGALDLIREDLRLHRLVVRELEPLHDVVDPVAREQAHEVVLAREVEAGLARVALAAGAAAELIVDPACLVALGAEDVQAAELADGVVDLDVDAAAGHVRRDGHRADLAGVLDDLGLARVLLGVEDVVRNALALEQLAEVLGGLDGDRADEHRLALLVALLDVGRRWPRTSPRPS